MQQRVKDKQTAACGEASAITFTKQQAIDLYEIAELASTLVYLAAKRIGFNEPTPLFAACEHFKDMAVKANPKLSGTALSDEYKNCEELLKELSTLN